MKNKIGLSGRDIVINNRRKYGVKRLIYGIAIVWLFAFVFSLVDISGKNPKQDASTIIFLAAILLVGLGFIVNGIMLLSAPAKGGSFKKYPDYLDMADRHFSQVMYEDNAIIISQNYISPKKNSMMITPLDEVFLIYIRKTSSYGLPTGRDIIYECARGKFVVPIYGKKSAEVDTIFQNSGYACKNARIGYSADNLTYLKQARAIWNQKHQNS